MIALTLLLISLEVLKKLLEFQFSSSSSIFFQLLYGYAPSLVFIQWTIWKLKKTDSKINSLNRNHNKSICNCTCSSEFYGSLHFSNTAVNSLFWLLLVLITSIHPLMKKEKLMLVLHSVAAFIILAQLLLDLSWLPWSDLSEYVLFMLLNKLKKLLKITLF